jgi:riboflavin synthase
MFTGIVEEAGEILERVETDDGLRLWIGCSFAGALRPGESVSTSGACLTVEEIGEDRFSVFLAAETLERTYLGELTEGARVNLERAMPADGRFDGHLVQGHVDATGEVRAVEPVGEDWRFAFSLPEALAPYVVEKGSVTVDGISLTVAARSEEGFEVAIIPTTYELTTLAEKAVGDPVHLEVDVIAKYVESVAEAYLDGATTADR